MTHEDERRAEALVRHLADAAAPGSPCLDADVVAGLADGRLPDAERSAALAHAADCADCRAWIAAVAVAVAEPVAAARVRRFPWGVAAAAALLVAVVTGIAGWWALRHAGPPTDERLVAAATALREAEPGLFAGFAPLTADERRAAGGSVERGGISGLRPRGALLDGRPSFSWDAVPGATSYRVRVRGEDGRVLLERAMKDTSLAYPADAPAIPSGAAFAWRVTAESAGTEAAGSAAARVLPADERSRYERGLAAIQARAPERLRAVLAAQWALRADLLVEARTLLDAAPPEGGWTDVESQTRALVARRLGLAIADAPR